MKVWGFYKGTGKLPGREEVANVLGKIGYRHIQLDQAGQTVRFDQPGHYSFELLVDGHHLRSLPLHVVAGDDDVLIGE